MQVKKILDELFQFSNEREWFEYKENWFEPVALGEYVSAISNTAIDNNIKYLRENGYIERIGENKNGSWKVLK